MIKVIKECYKFKSLIYELVLRDIKVRYRRSVLGLLWAMLVPILSMLVMNYVFSQLFRFDIENYVIYLLCGNILFTFFSEGTSSSLSSILENSSLIKKVYIPKNLFPIAKVCSSAVNLFFAVLSLMVVMLITKTPFYWTMLLIPLNIFYLFLFTMGLGMILATLTVFFRDISHMYRVIIMLLMYATPVFFPASLLAEKSQILLDINPIYHYINYLRLLVLEGKIPSLQENLICLVMGIVPVIIGLYAISKKQDQFILYI
jgi:ABC-2 type transport system permease protein